MRGQAYAFKDWKLGEVLGSGGNGIVYRAKRGNLEAALKTLKRDRTGEKRRARFSDEIIAMRRCADIPGVLPIYDSSDGEANYKEMRPWFAMGLARPILNELGERPTIESVVDAVHAFANTLSAMHARQISHRDIKPENLFRFSDQWCLGDFGLADFEGKSAETAAFERIGPVHYIAPEMLNTASQASGAQADVYSLAKTLWVLASGQRFPLPGHYTFEPVFRLGSYVSAGRTVQLDRLISASTEVEPSRRPTMKQFTDEVAAWKAAPAVQGDLQLPALAQVAARLQERKENSVAARERESILQQRQADTGRRIRELLRPLAKSLEKAFVGAHFDPVNLNIDSFHYGFELMASIPSDTTTSARLNFTTSIGTNLLPTVSISCICTLETVEPAGTPLVVWHRDSEFYSGGESEILAASVLSKDALDAVPFCAEQAANAALDPEMRRILTSFGVAEILIEGSDAAGIEGADAVFVASSGAYLRGRTNQIGQAVFTRIPTLGAEWLVACPGHRGSATPASAHPARVVLQKLSGGSAIVYLGIETRVPSLLGTFRYQFGGSQSLIFTWTGFDVEGSSNGSMEVSLGVPIATTQGSNVVILNVKALVGRVLLVEFEHK